MCAANTDTEPAAAALTPFSSLFAAALPPLPPAAQTMHALRTPVVASARPRMAAPRSAPRLVGRVQPKVQPVVKPCSTTPPARLSVVAAAAAGLDPLER